MCSFIIALSYISRKHNLITQKYLKKHDSTCTFEERTNIIWRFKGGGGGGGAQTVRITSYGGGSNEMSYNFLIIVLLHWKLKKIGEAKKMGGGGGLDTE